MNNPKTEIPMIIQGGLAVDNRGKVAFVNDFHLDEVKRFYVVSNHSSGFIRAWHGHKKEAKYVFAIKGSALVGAVKVNNWDNPSKDAEAFQHTLSANEPAVLYIPPGYVNGFMSLTEDASLMFFSTSTLEDSKNDDIRFDPHYWDIWDIKKR